MQQPWNNTIHHRNKKFLNRCMNNSTLPAILTHSLLCEQELGYFWAMLMNQLAHS